MIRQFLAFFLVTNCLLALAVDPPAQTTQLHDVTLDEDQLRVHFIDVGAGLAILIETPSDRKHIFVDGGNSGLDGLQHYLSHFVPHNGHINAAIVTHADIDHYLGMRRVMRDYEVDQFWYTGYTSDILKTRVNWNGLLNQVDQEQGIELESAKFSSVVR